MWNILKEMMQKKWACLHVDFSVSAVLKRFKKQHPLSVTAPFVKDLSYHGNEHRCDNRAGKSIKGHKIQALTNEGEDFENTWN